MPSNNKSLPPSYIHGNSCADMATRSFQEHCGGKLEGHALNGDYSGKLMVGALRGEWFTRSVYRKLVSPN